jgi:hypothetical protein
MVGRNWKGNSYPTTTLLRKQASFAKFILDSFGVRQPNVIRMRIASNTSYLLLVSFYRVSSSLMKSLKLSNHIYLANSDHLLPHPPDQQFNLKLSISIFTFI